MSYHNTITDKSIKKHLKFLSEGEQLKLVTGYSSLHLRERFIVTLIFPGVIFFVATIGWAYLDKFNLWFGFALGLIPAVAVACVVTWIVHKSHRFILTTRRVILREGFLKVKISSVLYDKVTHITVNQTLFDRLVLRQGTIVIDTSGSSGDELVLQFVEEPLEFKNILENLIHQHQQKPDQTKEN